MRLFLDTNVYIVGQLDAHSPENRILVWLEQNQNNPFVQVVISQELIEQILRVGKRVKNKDWASNIVNKIWQNLNYFFVCEDETFQSTVTAVKISHQIPAEDLIIYVSAKLGRADYFVSANRELIRSIADFHCCCAEDFVKKFLV